MNDLILIEKICTQYNIDTSFIDKLEDFGLIQIKVIEDNKFISPQKISNLEKMIRLHQELGVNVEGIDIILNILKRENELKKQIRILQNRLKLYEDYELE